MGTIQLYKTVEVHHKKTGKVTKRRIPIRSAPPPTERQKVCRQRFGKKSHFVAQWLKENDATAVPPKGSSAYQLLKKKFDRQNKLDQFFDFAIEHLNDNGEVI